MNWQTAKFVLLMPVRTPRPAPPPPWLKARGFMQVSFQILKCKAT
jgi:hypothetical protein